MDFIIFISFMSAIMIFIFCVGYGVTSFVIQYLLKKSRRRQAIKIAEKREKDRIKRFSRYNFKIK